MGSKLEKHHIIDYISIIIKTTRAITKTVRSTGQPWEGGRGNTLDVDKPSGCDGKKATK